MHKKCFAAAIAAVTPLAVALPSTTAKAENSTVKPIKVAVATGQMDFKSQLEKKAKSDPEARKSLRQYEALNAKQQAQLNEEISSGRAALALSEMMDSGGKSEPASLKRISPDSSFVVYDVSGNYSVEQRILGILITRLNQDFYWQTGDNRVLDTKRCIATAVNFNLGIDLQDSTDHWMQGGHGVCQTVWHGYLLFKGTHVRIDKKQWFEVDAKGYYSRWLQNV